MVFQLNGHHWNTVDSQHHVHTVVILTGVVPLPDTLANILAVVLHGYIVQGGLRLEVAHPELNPPVLEPVAQDADQPVVLHGVLKGPVEFHLRVGAALLLEPLPLDGLGGLDKSHQRSQIQRQLRRGPVACVCVLLPAAGGGNQEGFNILFQLFFVICHRYTSCDSFSVWDASKRCLLSTTA